MKCIKANIAILVALVVVLKTLITGYHPRLSLVAATFCNLLTLINMTTETPNPCYVIECWEISSSHCVALCISFFSEFQIYLTDMIRDGPPFPGIGSSVPDVDR